MQTAKPLQQRGQSAAADKACSRQEVRARCQLGHSCGGPLPNHCNSSTLHLGAVVDSRDMSWSTAKLFRGPFCEFQKRDRRTVLYAGTGIFCWRLRENNLPSSAWITSRKAPHSKYPGSNKRFKSVLHLKGQHRQQDQGGRTIQTWCASAANSLYDEPIWVLWMSRIYKRTKLVGCMIQNRFGL